VILLDARRAARERQREFDAAVTAEIARRAAEEREGCIPPRRLRVVN
jgi:hypothetical protein